MITKVTTETGSYYRFDVGHWTKYNPDGRFVDAGSLWALKLASEDAVMDWPHKHPDQWTDVTVDELIVGRFMYVRGKDTWWVTTPIVSIEEVEDERD